MPCLAQLIVLLSLFLLRSITNMFSSSTFVATVLALFAGTSLGAWDLFPTQ